MPDHTHRRWSLWQPLFASLAAAVSLTVQAQALPVMIVQPQPVELTLPADALVEAVNQATVAAQVSGRVVDAQVDAGQAVRKGDLLMNIDAREANEVAAGASAQYVNARAHHQRMLSLRQQGFVSQAAVDKAKADLDAAQAAQGQAAVGAGHATVRAPISTRKAADGALEMAPRAKISVLAHDSLRVEPYTPAVRVVPVP